MGFISGGRSFGAGVVVRVSRSGWVWALRARRRGLAPAPACVFVPFGSWVSAQSWARQCARLGWRVWLRPGKRCQAAFEVKVALPSGVSPRVARSLLPPLSVPSSLAGLL